ncbi:MAG TPA: VWA domain-containing protein [Burkholderiales bacterium]|nr:VWA domain-containing protein [Burkholderiales bacterium]
MKGASSLAALGVLLFIVACGPEANHNQAVYVLIDTSGTYAKETGKAQLVVNYLLGSLNPGDALAVGRVKSRSFSEKDIVAKVSLGKDPLAANAQKRAFSEQVADFAKTTKDTKGSRYTDITGGLILAAEFLNESQAGRKTIVIFSDMQEELDYKTVRDFPIRLDGIRVVALNVTKLDTDNVDPRRYLDRLEWWEKRARTAGASDWKVVNDMEHLDRIFKKSS